MIISVHSVLSYNTNKPIRAKTKLLKNIYRYLDFFFSLHFFAFLFSFWNELKSDNTEWSNSKMEWRETATRLFGSGWSHDGVNTRQERVQAVIVPLMVVCPRLGEGMANGTQLRVWSPWGVSGLSRLFRAKNFETFFLIIGNHAIWFLMTRKT